MNKTVVVFAPHQDDECIGCGGFIADLVMQGAHVIVAFGTIIAENSQYRKYHTQTKEYIEYTGADRLRETMGAKNALGYHSIEILYPSDNHHRLDFMPLAELLKAMEAVVKKYNPSVILFPAKSSNQDHEAMNRACHSLIRPQFFTGSAYEYEVQGETDFKPDTYFMLSKYCLESKLKAFDAYKTQHSGDMHPISHVGIQNKLRHRGYECGMEYAEAYKTVRRIL